MKKRKTIMILVIAIGLMVVCSLATAGNLQPPAAPGPTMKTLDQVEPRIPIPESNTPSNAFIISQGGSYYLTGNRTASVTAILVEANDVTIDLMGYSLIGTGNGYGIYMNARNNVEIRNGTIRNFGYSGIFEPSDLGKQNRVFNMRVLSNGLYGIYLRGRGNVVRDCTVAENGKSGIFAYYSSIITGNNVYNNDTGIYAYLSSMVTGNNVYHNDIGISASVASTVTGNMAYRNRSTGIYVSYGCTVIGNTARDNDKNGIYTGSGCTIVNNTIYNNQWSGLYAGPSSTVIGNTAYWNQRYGILLSGDSLVDQNTATNNNQSGGGYSNMNNPISTCTFGLNHAP